MQAAKQPSELKPHAELLVEAILRQVAGWYEQAAKTEHTHVESITYHTGMMPTLGFLRIYMLGPKLRNAKARQFPRAGAPVSFEAFLARPTS